MLRRKRPTTRRVGSEYPDDELTAQNRELFGLAVRGTRSNGRAVDDEDAARHLARHRKLDGSETEVDPITRDRPPERPFQALGLGATSSPKPASSRARSGAGRSRGRSREYYELRIP